MSIVNPNQTPMPISALDMADDPWAHRSTGMRCHTCMFYVDKPVQVGAPRLGRCRRHAPTLQGYPVVYSTDWCGDHKLDHEEKKA